MVDERIVKKYAKLLIDKPHTLSEIAEKLGKSRTEVKRDMRTLKRELGMNIVSEKFSKGTYYFIPSRERYIPKNNLETDYFALISDTHIGNRYAEEEALKEFYDEVYSRGIHEVFHAGDLLEGVGVYKGQINDLAGDSINTQEQIEKVIKNYPKKRKVKTYVIAGNHDLKNYTNQGVDPVKMISERRSDFVYLGQYYGRVKLPEDIILELIHPSGSAPYSKDYAMLKYLRNRAKDSYPDILSMGHYHSSMYRNIQGTHAFMPGCFLGETDFTRRMGFEPAIGGWILEVKIKDGKIRKIRQEWIDFS